MDILSGLWVCIGTLYHTDSLYSYCYWMASHPFSSCLGLCIIFVCLRLCRSFFFVQVLNHNGRFRTQSYYTLIISVCFSAALVLCPPCPALPSCSFFSEQGFSPSDLPLKVFHQCTTKLIASAGSPLLSNWSPRTAYCGANEAVRGARVSLLPLPPSQLLGGGLDLPLTLPL